MIEAVKQILDLPEKAYVPRVMPKNFFDRNFKLTTSEKKLINTPFLPIRATWIAELNSKTVNISELKNEQEEFTRIPIFCVELSQEHWNTLLNKLITLYHKHIPFPVVLFLYTDSGYVMSVTDKVINSVDRSKRVVEKEYTTPEISRLLNDDLSQRFKDSLQFSNLNRINLKTVNASYTAAIVNYRRAKKTGNFENKREIKKLDKNLDTLASLEKQLIALRNKLQKAKDVRLKVALQMELSELREKKVELEKSL